MRIAIVAPDPESSVVGGAELLVCGMHNAIGEFTGHQCEIVKLRVREDNFWNIIESYYRFYLLDLSRFDLVISTKYPSWMVRHQNHSVYMIHHLRGLFDTYHLFHEPYDIPDHLRVGLVDEIIRITEKKKLLPGDIDQLFGKIFSLKEERGNYDAATFTFPGPFIRNIIHCLDGYALDPSRVKQYYAMSENVRRREKYFPLGVRVKVIYPPSTIPSLQPGEYTYLFTASRLDGPKRIDLLIKSMEYVPHPVQLKIAGTGPELKNLKKIAEHDRRIEFLGFVSERELQQLYSGALVVLFVPYDEDYGLITIEGMMSRKPVITSIDSGGPLEFVRDAETGYVVDPDPRKIAEKINYLVENRDEAEKLGGTAFDRVHQITWRNFVNDLLQKEGVPDKRKLNILVLCTYSCFPPRGGGQHRLFNLYSRMAKDFNITICSIIESNKEHKNLILANGLKQICIPQSGKHAENQWNLERKSGANLYDIGMIDFIELSDEYVRSVKTLITESDIVIFSHPYLFGLYRYVTPSQITVYEAHNSEYLLKRDYLKEDTILSKVFSIEKQACAQSELIWSTSEEDRQNLIRLYGVSPDKIVTIPNGVDPSLTRFIESETRTESKQDAGLNGHPTILFVGSWHPPNLEALDFIVENLAKKNTRWKFIIVGSVRDYYLHEKGTLPKNVLAFGAVDENEKYELYKLADIAINPMFSGSGTNLKMLDYMSAGIPVITTPVGGRGLGLSHMTDAVICEPDQFSESIRFLLNNGEMRETLRRNARRVVEEQFSWGEIAKAAVQTLRKTDTRI